MKAIKSFLLTTMLILMVPALTECTDYQDEIDALDYRITILENLVKQLNSDLESMQVIVTAMETGDYITNVTESSRGYIITFNKFVCYCILKSFFQCFPVTKTDNCIPCSRQNILNIGKIYIYNTGFCYCIRYGFYRSS